jgi:hypothetical protein
VQGKGHRDRQVGTAAVGHGRTGGRLTKARSHWMAVRRVSSSALPARSTSTLVSRAKKSGVSEPGGEERTSARKSCGRKGGVRRARAEG